MIKQLPAHHIKTLKAVGSIEFRVEAAFSAIGTLSNFMNIPHKAVYVQRDEEPQHLFNCNISFLDKLIAVNDIARPKAGVVLLTKEQEYLLFGLVIDAATDLAVSQNKTKVIIASSITCAADILVERDFVTRPLKNSGGYRGVKILRKDKDEDTHSDITRPDKN